MTFLFFLLAQIQSTGSDYDLNETFESYLNRIYQEDKRNKDIILSRVEKNSNKQTETLEKIEELRLPPYINDKLRGIYNISTSTEYHYYDKTIPYNPSINFEEYIRDEAEKSRRTIFRSKILFFFEFRLRCLNITTILLKYYRKIEQRIETENSVLEFFKTVIERLNIEPPKKHPNTWFCVNFSCFSRPYPKVNQHFIEKKTIQQRISNYRSELFFIKQKLDYVSTIVDFSDPISKEIRAFIDGVLHTATRKEDREIDRDFSNS